MYVRRSIRLKHFLVESWLPLVVVTAWSVVVVVLHNIAGFRWLVMPVLPVTLIGIAVSLYVGFKSVSAYNRWWEARQALGGIVAMTREWVLHVQGMIDGDKAPAGTQDQLLRHHLAWLYAVACSLRRDSRLKASKRTRMFKHRSLGHEAAQVAADPQSYGRFLSADEFAAAQAVRNPAAYLLRRQAMTLQSLQQAGVLGDEQHVATIELLGRLTEAHGICERIKTTPFPRQIAHFGTIFTWLFVFLLPLAFLDVFESKSLSEFGRHQASSGLTSDYLFMLVPFSAVISWVFLMMEKISDSTEDPFEGGVHDVPVLTLCRLMEIDVKQAMGETDVPPPLAPVDDVLY